MSTIAIRQDADAAAAPPRIAAEAPAFAVLALWFAAAGLMGLAFDVPVIDDWAYAWSVEQVLHTGTFDVLDFSAVYPLALALWGAAWSWLFGFSFVTLRLSTLVLAFVAACALHLLLRELGAPRRVALLGAFAAAVNPAVYLLSSSFMTDVPFVACTMLSLLCYVRADVRGRSGLVWWGGFWALVSLLIRQVGIVTPVAALALLVPRRTREGPKPLRVAAALGCTWLAMGLTWWALRVFVGSTTVMTSLQDRVGYLLLVSAENYAKYNLYLVTTLGFYLLPALLALASAWRLWRSPVSAAAAGASAAVLFAALGEIPQPLHPGNTWNLVELGGARALLNGPVAADAPGWLVASLRVAALLAVSIAAAALVVGLRTWFTRIATPGERMEPLAARAAALVDFVAGRGHGPVVLYVAGYVALVNALWLYHDRYWLPLLFGAVVLVLGRGVTVPRRPIAAWCVATAFGITAVVGTRDALRYNQAVHDSWQALIDRGVPKSDIDAGYSWNGWILYAHPENLGAGLKAESDVPWISSSRRTRYILGKAPLARYRVERAIAWSDLPWPGPDRLLVLEREDEAGRSGAPSSSRLGVRQ